MMVQKKTSLLTRLRDDAAAATLVTGIISMLFLILCLGFALDLTKNAYLKNAQHSQAQQAAEAAVKQVDQRGSLSRASDGAVPDAVKAMVVEYQNQKLSAYDNALVGAGVHNDETEAYRLKNCRTQEITTNDGRKQNVTLPYMVITLEPERTQGSVGTARYVSQGGAVPVSVGAPLSGNVRYKVITAEVHDASSNLMLGMFGAPCQKYNANISAIAFGNQEDLAIAKG